MTRFHRFLLPFCLAVLMLSCATRNAPAAPAEDSRAAELWKAANSAYQNEHFSDAADLYQQFINLHGPSAPVFYNLGNAWYRQGETGKAMLNYERARIINPRDEEIAFNREFLIREAGAAIPEAGRFGFLMRSLTLNETLILTALFAWITILLFLIGGLRSFRRKQFVLSWFVAGLVILMVTVLGFVTIFYLTNSRYHPGFAVVTEGEGTEARAQPAQSADALQAFSAGSQIFIEATRGRWHYVRLPGGGQGWLPVETVERVLRPWAVTAEKSAE